MDRLAGFKGISYSSIIKTVFHLC